MTRSTRRRQRASTTALLLLVLTITTGWTQPAQPSAKDTGSLAGAQQLQAAGERHDPEPAWPNVQAIQATSNLAADRLSEAALTSGVRALLQARMVALRATRPIVERPRATVVNEPEAKAVVKTYAGTNHFWFPALGISKSVHVFECTRKREPDNYVYRWGCAGKNNVYLLGHAATVFRSLHDRYVSGRLRVGMVAIYADRNGRIHKFKVTSWRVVRPDEASWAMASQPVSSMTLQTCVGLKRLNVRLVEFH